ncbi:MAG: hypothetical protein PHS59_03875 [Paludibacter sp.]|nr:hypothetical protein [Paludibacter sp.]
MKRKIIIYLFVLFTGSLLADNINQSDVPAVVLNTFQLKFPTSDNVKWKLEKGNYQVDFKVNSKDNKLTIDYKGNVLKHNQDLFVSEIPRVVLETIKKKARFFDINDADKYVDGNKITYVIQFKIDRKDYFFWIDEKGKLLKYRRELKESEIPSSMIQFINNKYGTIDYDRAKFIEENGKINYIIRVKINNMDHIFWMGNNGVLLKHIQDLRDSEIPSPVLNAAKNDYSDYKLHDAQWIEERGKSIYKLGMRKSNKKVNLTINTQGKILDVK